MESIINEINYDVDNSWTIYEVAKNKTPESWIVCFNESEDEIKYISNIIENKYKGKGIIRPAMKDLFNAFWYTNIDNVKIIIIGQDPYPNNHATGLAFSGLPNFKIPSSLDSIFKELYNTVEGFIIPKDGDLRGWAMQGVLLLNISLTIFNDIPGIHDQIWDGFIINVIKHINQKNPNAVYIIWGGKAERIKNFIDKNPFIQGGHPSTNNSNNDFLGGDYFNKANFILSKNGIKKIDWTKTSYDSVKNENKEFFEFLDLEAKLKFEEAEKRKKDEKNYLNPIMKDKLLRAFNEDKIEEIIKSKININCIKNWAKEYQIKIPSGMNRINLIKYIHSCVKKGLNNKKTNFNKQFKIINYNIISDNWINEIFENGFSITNLFNYDTNILDEFYNWMKQCNNNFDINNNKSWSLFKGYNKYYITQTKFLWNIRELLYPYFCKIWKNDNLLCSFEGVTFNYKLNEENDIIRGDQVLHIDQKIETFSCIRAIVFLTDSNDIIFVNNSRNIHKNYIDILKDNYDFKPKLGDDIFNDSELIRINAKSGDVLFFDARMFYFYSIIPNTKNIYTWVSMQPTNGIMKNELKRRVYCYKKGMATNHWCYGNEFKSYPEHKFKNLKQDNNIKPEKIEIIELNELQKSLVGL